MKQLIYEIAKEYKEEFDIECESEMVEFIKDNDEFLDEIVNAFQGLGLKKL